MKQWVKRLSYIVSGAGFIAVGIFLDKITTANWWEIAMVMVGFMLTTIGGFFVKPQQT